MKGYIKVAAAIPRVTVADPQANLKSICRLCHNMDTEGVTVAVFPELCLSGYTCADLFHNTTLLENSLLALRELATQSLEWDIVIIVGLPLAVHDALYNVAAVVHKGKVAGFVPKTYIPNYNEFYEKRWWSPAPATPIKVELVEGNCPIEMFTRQLFQVGDMVFGIEICEDLWTPIPPSSRAAMAGAHVMFNLSASDALISKYDYVRNLVSGQSARCLSAYVYASAGFGESSTDLAFDGITLIAENGHIINEGRRWTQEEFYTAAHIDLTAIMHDRLTMSSFDDCRRINIEAPYVLQNITRRIKESEFDREIAPLPFVPASSLGIGERCDEIVNIQTTALAQRLSATATNNVVIGISGGLDSTLALLVAVRTFDRLKLDRKGIHAITMPGFGTTDRTYRNAVDLIKTLGTSFREINIVPAVNQHFKDIGHNPTVKNVTYENSQARQRTLLLMNIANQVCGMVIGTGDLSELALGWATYNGDHMSMYGVNVGIPKTLVRYLVARFAQGEARLIESNEEARLRTILNDIVDTPISPELIPADEGGNITQKTEDLVGPYALHDFFLYYTLRYGLGPDYIYPRAVHAFRDTFSPATILKWLRVFTRRFFTQQFKRSCLPDGPKVGSVCLSPRGDWRMPSDATYNIWMNIIDSLQAKLVTN